MFVDIVIPTENELEFVKIAKRLDIDGLLFVYENIKSYKEHFLRIKEKETKIKIYSAFLSDGKKILKPKQFDRLIIKSTEKNRAFFENKNIDLIYDLENISRNDFIHQRNSGFNHILAKLALEKNISVGINFSSLLNENKDNQIKIMGRIMQNVMLCQKYKVNIKIASFAKNPYDMRSPRDLRALGGCLGMNSLVAKSAICDNYFDNFNL
jgi:RNase P/RNase MRP subunit p30